MFYLITITGSALLIAIMNFIFDGVYTFLAFGELVLFTFLGVVAVIAVDGVLAFIARRLPENGFHLKQRCFR